MKHKFLLDENILHFAIKGIDENGNPDESSTRLVQLVAFNCHTIAVNRFLLDRYWLQVNRIRMEGRRATALEPVFFIVQLLNNSLKWAFEQGEPPGLPEGVTIPAEDVEIVKLALQGGARIVTGDADLRTAVNNSPSLKLHALTPVQALPLAADR